MTENITAVAANANETSHQHDGKVGTQPLGEADIELMPSGERLINMLDFQLGDVHHGLPEVVDTTGHPDGQRLHSRHEVEVIPGGGASGSEQRHRPPGVEGFIGSQPPEDLLGDCVLRQVHSPLGRGIGVGQPGVEVVEARSPGAGRVDHRGGERRRLQPEVGLGLVLGGEATVGSPGVLVLGERGRHDHHVCGRAGERSPGQGATPRPRWGRRGSGWSGSWGGTLGRPQRESAWRARSAALKYSTCPGFST